MEICKQTTGNKAYLDGESDWTVSATVAVEPDAPVATSVSFADGAWSLNLPYVLEEGNISVVWSFSIPGQGLMTKEDTYYAVTPYLTPREILSIWPEAEPHEIIEVEAAVRHIINANTGQQFGYSKNKTLTVEGHGETVLRLPERLISITGVNTLNSSLAVGAFIIVSDGWYLKKAWAAATPRELVTESQYWGDITDGVFNNNIYDDSDDGYNPGYNSAGILVDPTLTPVSARQGGIIVSPGSSGRSTPWKNDYPFEITGDWGYKTIPANVKEAARLLVNDYACSEIAYRDRYLESIKAADWRLQFSSRAWDSTGNVRADQLLAEYVLMDWAII